MRATRIISGILLASALYGCQTTGASGGATPVEVTRPTAEEAKERTISPAAQRKFGDAVRAYQEGVNLKVVDWDSLARKFQAAVDEDDDLAEAHYNLGVIAERQGKPDEAVKHYRNAIERKPSLSAAYENLGVLMENGGDRGGAEEQYKAILRTYPEDAGARARLAVLYREGGDLDRAVELAQEALLRDPKNVTAHKVLIEVHLERNKLDLAKLVAVRAIKLDEKDAELAFALGRILEKEGNAEAAAAQYRQAVTLRGDFLPARVLLAGRALENGDWPGAAAEYEAVTRYAPKQAGAWLGLAMAQRGLGKYDEALSSYGKAQELAPDDASPSFGIGLVLHKHKDQPEKAIEHYRRFISAAAANLPAEHPVFANLRECEQIVSMKAEQERMAREAAAQAAAESAKAGGAPAEGEKAPKPEEDEDVLAGEGREVAPKPAAKQAPKAAAADPDEPDDDF